MWTKRWITTARDTIHGEHDSNCWGSLGRKSSFVLGRLAMLAHMGAPNLRTLWMSSQPLGIACRCGHRALISHETLGAHSGNMTEIWTLRFRCTACGARGNEHEGIVWKILHGQDQVDAFERGEIESSIERGPPTF